MAITRHPAPLTAASLLPAGSDVDGATHGASGERFVTESERRMIRAHYERAMPWLLRQFGGTPVVAVSYPRGFAGDPTYHKGLWNAPAGVASVAVRTSTGVHRYARLDAANIAWLLESEHAVELDGWSPTLDDPDQAAFGRIMLSPSGGTTDVDVTHAALVLRESLAAQELQAIFLLDGFRGACLWIPFDDGPSYERMGAWLHDFTHALALQHSATLTTAALRKDRGDRVYLGTNSNHPGMGSLLPYALRGTPSLEVSIPLPWADVGKVHNGTVTAQGFAEYQRLFGDVFEDLRIKIGGQSFGDRTAAKAGTDAGITLAAGELAPKGYIIAAALAVLADGRAHGADDILKEALARNLLPASTTRKYVYTALHEYVVRTLGMGKAPELIQLEGTAEFRLNRPGDEWPQIALPPLPSWLAPQAALALVARLQTTATGGDPSAFEIAACDAFAALGFLATHVGGNAAPDGILTAPLGPAGYRIVLECKTASPGGIVANPRPEEPAKFRSGAGAQFAMLVGPAFGNDVSFENELAQHDVSCWTVDDLVQCLGAEIGPDELRAALVAGRARIAVAAILWEREHGRRKRVEAIAQLAARAGWELQRTLAAGVPLAQTPVLGEQTLFALVDEELVRDGVTSGASLDEAREALRVLQARGILRALDEGYVVRQPVAPTAARPQ